MPNWNIILGNFRFNVIQFLFVPKRTNGRRTEPEICTVNKNSKPLHFLITAVYDVMEPMMYLL